jgi:hypothetical protein
MHVAVLGHTHSHRSSGSQAIGHHLVPGPGRAGPRGRHESYRLSGTTGPDRRLGKLGRWINHAGWLEASPEGTNQVCAEAVSLQLQRMLGRTLGVSVLG